MFALVACSPSPESSLAPGGGNPPPPPTPEVDSTESRTRYEFNNFTVNVLGDSTNYVQPPVRDREPTEAEITAYRTFTDPFLSGKIYTLTAAATGQRVQTGSDGALSQGAVSSALPQQFRLLTVSAESCATFPEA